VIFGILVGGFGLARVLRAHRDGWLPHIEETGIRSAGGRPAPGWRWPSSLPLRYNAEGVMDAREVSTRPQQAMGARATTGPAVEVRPVQGRREMSAFVKLPFRLYRGQDNWVPPLIAERKRHLDRKHNPFFEHAEAEYFLAWRDCRPVGRISAHVDHRFNEFQQHDWGLFGFFECENDPDAAAALFASAEAWLRERARDRMVGPMDFSTNHECGLLVEGYERKPQILENWHHPYYRGLFAQNGLAKAMDLLKWQIMPDERHRMLPVIQELAGKLEPEHGIHVRNMRKRNMHDEVRAFMEVYNAAWEDNWGFVPLTDAELAAYAKELKPILQEKWGLIAEKDGEVVGAALTLDDYNLILPKLNGRLLPLGWLKLLRERRKIDEVRVFALGVKREYQHTGTAAAFYVNVWDTVRASGVTRAETGWILETNEPMNRAMEALGGDVIKRYRVFERVFG
jgi:GNAT superfamily N-acetyltransferase